MKTILTLTATFLMAFSLNTIAGNKNSNFSSDKPKTMVAVAPFEWGNPNEAAPAELRFVKAKYAKVPVAPFVWGNAGDDAPDLQKIEE
ncbi:MAG: hypothetical protein WC220_03785 [Pedobacter sp.]|jgi:hypothetical protein